MLSDEIYKLYQEQYLTWKTFQTAVDGLQFIKQKELQVFGDQVLVQFNPIRLSSTLAKITPEEIKVRPCFLCEQNRPLEQKGLIWREKYQILVNPKPAFQKHFTVVNKNHIQQLINLEDFIALASEIGEELVLFFNAASSGASCPDHLHYQICPKMALPLFKDESRLIKSSLFIKYGILYHVFYFDSVNSVKDKLQNLLNSQPELQNVWASTYKGKIICIISLRKKHRPSFYDEIKVSPACIEMAGVLITVREDDFKALNNTYAEKLFLEVGEAVTVHTTFN